MECAEGLANAILKNIEDIMCSWIPVYFPAIYIGRCPGGSFSRSVVTTPTHCPSSRRYRRPSATRLPTSWRSSVAKSRSCCSRKMPQARVLPFVVPPFVVFCCCCALPITSRTGTVVFLPLFVQAHDVYFMHTIAWISPETCWSLIGFEFRLFDF